MIIRFTAGRPNTMPKVSADPEAIFIPAWGRGVIRTLVRSRGRVPGSSAILVVLSKPLENLCSILTFSVEKLVFIE